MSGALGIENCKRYAERKGGKCLTSRFVDLDTDMLWRCKNKHYWRASYNDVYRGEWCDECDEYENKKEQYIEGTPVDIDILEGLCIDDEEESSDSDLFTCFPLKERYSSFWNKKSDLDSLSLEEEKREEREEHDSLSLEEEKREEREELDSLSLEEEKREELDRLTPSSKVYPKRRRITPLSEESLLRARRLEMIRRFGLPEE